MEISLRVPGGFPSMKDKRALVRSPSCERIEEKSHPMVAKLPAIVEGGLGSPGKAGGSKTPSSVVLISITISLSLSATATSFKLVGIPPPAAAVIAPICASVPLRGVKSKKPEEDAGGAGPSPGAAVTPTFISTCTP
jgi:hypothetical protein